MRPGSRRYRLLGWLAVALVGSALAYRLGTSTRVTAQPPARAVVTATGLGDPAAPSSATTFVQVQSGCAPAAISSRVLNVRDAAYGAKGNGALVMGEIPFDAALLDLCIYAQLAVFDSSAAGGVAMSQALELRLGD